MYEHNSTEKLPMASTTKIMTSLLLAEQEDLSKQIVCTKEMVTVEGSSMGLLVGDHVTYNDLLYGMLLASGNDAANTTAIALGGSIEGFVNLMNQKAKALKLENTHFVTPSGLDSQEHYTTAYDLAKLAAFALKNERFKKAASSISAKLCYGNPPYNRTLTNHNKLLKSYQGLIGVKTGFTKKAGRCLVTAAQRDDAQIVVVTLNDKNDWQDHKNLLDFGFSRLNKTTLNFNEINELPIIGAQKSFVKLECESASLYMQQENFSKLTYKVNLPSLAFAPVKKGDVLGNAEIIFNDNVIKKINIVSEENIDIFDASEQGLFSKIFDIFIKIISKI